MLSAFKMILTLFCRFSNILSFKSVTCQFLCLFKHVAELYLPFELMQHKNQIVNEELWKEAETYGDIQLMPFVDYYSLITWKTLAICIFGVIRVFYFN